MTFQYRILVPHNFTSPSICRINLKKEILINQQYDNSINTDGGALPPQLSRSAREYSGRKPRHNTTKQGHDFAAPNNQALSHTPPARAVSFDKSSGLSYHVVNADAFDAIQSIPDQSIDFVVTDPPYFIDGMDGDWNDRKLSARMKKAGVVGGLPATMPYNRTQSKKFEEFMRQISLEIFRVLKPGAFYVCFSQCRLYHRLGVAVEDAGFEIRDGLAWQRSGQAKAFSHEHFVRNRQIKGLITQAQADEMIARLGGRKTAQLRPVMEWMVLAQKPVEGTYVDNWLKWGVGLMDTTQSLDGKFPSALMDVPRDKRDAGNHHLTVKPVKLIDHLIRLFTTEGQTVLDPFFGSGSHGVAAILAGRRVIGIERCQESAAIARARLEAATSATNIKADDMKYT